MLKKPSKLETGKTVMPKISSPNDEEYKKPKKSFQSDDDDDFEDSDIAAYRERRAAARRAEEAAEKTKYPNFTIRDGETTIISFPAGFLDFAAHSLKVGKYYPKVRCHKDLGEKTCPYCKDGVRVTDSIAIPVLDYRGKWDSESKSFEGGYDKKNRWVEAEKPASRLWVLSQRQFDSIVELCSRKRKHLSEVMIEVSRTGSNKKTVYNYSLTDEVEMFEGPFKEDLKLYDPEEIFSEPVFIDDYVAG